MIYWVKDLQKYGLDLDLDNFIEDDILEAEMGNYIRKELKENLYPNVNSLGKFYPDIFKFYKNDFIEILEQYIFVHNVYL